MNLFGINSHSVLLTRMSQDVINTSVNWHSRVIAQLNDFDRKLEEKIPNFTFQIRIDQLICSIESTFSPLVKFNAWLRENGEGSWTSRLAWYLGSLPFKAACNIVQQLYSIIRGVLYGYYTTHTLGRISRKAI